jgi:hypothetical protein
MGENTDVKGFNFKVNTFLTQFIFYSSFLVVTTLLIGNILNIMICMRKIIRKEMMGFYNIIISLFNILTLSIGLLFYFPPTINAQDLLLVSNFSCVTLSYAMRVCVQMSAWLHVFLSLDRYSCVAFNQKLAFILNDRKKLSFIILGLFGIICVINVSNLLFRVSTTNFAPYMQCDSTPLTIQIRNTIITIFRIILPLILQIVFSTLLIFNLFKVRRTVMMNQTMKKEYRFARVILWLNLMFFINETPIFLITLYLSITGEIPKYPLDDKTSDSEAIVSLIYYILYFFSLYLFGSIFFVNLFTNKIFKREILKIFKCRN